MSNNIFEQATRQKLRFDSVQGPLDVEQLWGLPIKSTRSGQADLDTIYKGLSREIKAAEEDSLVPTESVVDKKAVQTQLKHDIVKYIAAVKHEENSAAASASAKKAEKEQLLEILARKRNQKLEESSEEDIIARINAL